METEVQNLKNYLTKLGLEPEVASIYFALHTGGPQTISELARNAKVERTHIYRLQKQLAASSLVEVEAHHKKTIYKAAPITNLRILITQKEQEIETLKAGLGGIENALKTSQIANPATKVQFYNGAEGVKQMQWNLLKSKSTIFSTMNHPMQGVTGEQFFKRWAEKCSISNFKVHLLYDEQFLKESADWHAKNPGNKATNHASRLLPEKAYKIAFCTDIYDNVTAFYNWHKGEVFGIEIYNQDIADSQRAFFELLWNQAMPSPLDNGLAN